MTTSNRKSTALAILHEADAALAGWSCESSTDCCRFAVTGREPWVTQVEWELVVDEVKRQGRRLPQIPDDDDERCPFLNEAGRCSVYASRPLGCRTFYCERASGPGTMPSKELRALPRKLEALTTIGTDGGGVGAGDNKARPIRSWLRQAAGGRAARRR